MSHPLVLALYADVASAAEAARAAHALGIDRADVSVVARDHADEGRIANQIDASPELRNSLTYDNLAGSLHELQNSVREFRTDPKKFLRIKLF